MGSQFSSLSTSDSDIEAEVSATINSIKNIRASRAITMTSNSLSWRQDPFSPNFPSELQYLILDFYHVDHTNLLLFQLICKDSRDLLFRWLTLHHQKLPWFLYVDASQNNTYTGTLGNMWTDNYNTYDIFNYKTHQIIRLLIGLMFPEILCSRRSIQCIVRALQLNPFEPELNSNLKTFYAKWKLTNWEEQGLIHYLKNHLRFLSVTYVYSAKSLVHYSFQNPFKEIMEHCVLLYSKKDRRIRMMEVSVHFQLLPSSSQSNEDEENKSSIRFSFACPMSFDQSGLVDHSVYNYVISLGQYVSHDPKERDTSISSEESDDTVELPYPYNNNDGADTYKLKFILYNNRRLGMSLQYFDKGSSRWHRSELDPLPRMKIKSLHHFDHLKISPSSESSINLKSVTYDFNLELLNSLDISNRILYHVNNSTTNNTSTTINE